MNQEIVKKFIFRASEENLELSIPELLKPGYSFYTWPSATILANFLWYLRKVLPDKRILELGSGTSLPGILAAKCGALVTLSDLNLPKTLSHIERSCNLNDLRNGENIEIIGLNWGILGSYNFQDKLDLIIASDVFYDPSVFEDILVTVSHLLDQNPAAKFIFTYQERSSDWTLQSLLKKWDLHCVYIDTEPVEKYLGIDFQDLSQGHEIYLLEITKK